MYLELQKRLGAHLRSVLVAKYGLKIENIPLEIPPDLQFGELATPIAFELARKLRKAPRIIAQEIVTALIGLEGFAGFEVAGAGYINARLDRAAGVAETAAMQTGPLASTGIHTLVEHTSINPNKAAHVGHLRNAILGDTFVRLLRAAGQPAPDTPVLPLPPGEPVAAAGASVPARKAAAAAPPAAKPVRGAIVK